MNLRHGTHHTPYNAICVSETLKVQDPLSYVGDDPATGSPTVKKFDGKDFAGISVNDVVSHIKKDPDVGIVVQVARWGNVCMRLPGAEFDEYIEPTAGGWLITKHRTQNSIGWIYKSEDEDGFCLVKIIA